MKKKLVKRLLRLLLFFFIFLSGLVVFMLNPQVLYANKYQYKQLCIYSSHPYNGENNKVFDKALSLISQSELYDSNYKMDVFLDGGNSVKLLLTKTFGDAYAWGYHNNIVVNGETDKGLTRITLRNYQRHFARTVAHEMVHCLQLHQFGLFKARPLKNIPIWKWEGYPEYIAYKSSLQNEKEVLLANIKLLQKYQQENKTWIEINIDEGKTFTGIDYMKAWLMIKYLIDIKGMRYRQILKQEIREETVFDEMISWFHQQTVVK